MQLSPISLAITRLGGVRFSPSALFATGAQGVWYDPSDITTLFQDSAGTTPVTAVEQPVGLMLDKSQGLVLGSELVTNGDFSNGTTGWSAFYSSGTGSLVVSGGVATLTSGTGYATAGQSITTVVGQWYKVTGTITSAPNSGFNAFRKADQLNPATNIVDIISTSSAITSTTTATGYFLATATTSWILFQVNAVGGTISFDNISVKSIAGNHAYQTTSASRPTLRARYNLLTYSEQFDNPVWQGSAVTVTPNTFAAPDGTTTADTIASTNGYFYQEVSGLTANTVYTGSIYLYAPVAINGLFIRFTNTSFVAIGTGTTVNVTAGWNRFTFSDNIGANTTVRLVVGGVGTFPNGTSMYVWGAQLTQTAVFPSNTYQRIAAATDYATGAAFPPYLFFDGVDDSLLTNSVDFSATDKMTVWAGVTKSSDAAAGMLAELSSDVSVNAGSFYATAPESALIRYSIISRGNAALNANQRADTSSNTYLAPITNVLTGTFNISGDSNILRLNGAQVSQATGDQGTGNFGNYPLYIGRRNNATVPLNGNIYSLIIRGAQSTSDQIISTEQWVAQKSGITIS